MKKKVLGVIKLQIPAGQAKAGPPVGPALAQYKLNIMEFCKAFNAATKDLDPGEPVPVEISAHEDKSFTFVTKTPPASYLLRKVARIDKGCSRTGHEGPVATLSVKDIESVAEKKMKDLNAYDLAGAVRIIEGTARSMNISVSR